MNLWLFCHAFLIINSLKERLKKCIHFIIQKWWRTITEDEWTGLGKLPIRRRNFSTWRAEINLLVSAEPHLLCLWVSECKLGLLVQIFLIARGSSTCIKTLGFISKSVAEESSYPSQAPHTLRLCGTRSLTRTCRYLNSISAATLFLYTLSPRARDDAEQ